MHSKLIGALSIGILIGVILGIVASRTARAPGSPQDVIRQGVAGSPAGASLDGDSGSVAMIAGGEPDSPVDTAAEESKLVEIVRAIHQAVEAGDLSALHQYGSAGLEGFVGDRVTAKEFVEEFNRRYLPAGRVRVQANEISAHVVGRVGWTASDETWTLEANSAAPQTIRVLSTIVFLREDGQWRMAHVHQSPAQQLMADAVPPPHAAAPAAPPAAPAAPQPLISRHGG